MPPYDKYLPLQKHINIEFKHPKTLELVFTHKSFINECKDKKREHNERLEFLGDAILELVTTEHLYQNYPNPEGDLTNWRAALVKGVNLAKVARELNLGHYLFLSKGEETSGGRSKGYILANTVEALIGGIYLDRGMPTAKKFISNFILLHLPEIIEKGLYIDSKSHFQEMAQEKVNVTPEYKVQKEDGPDHNKTFTMAVYLDEKKIAEGDGTSKQNAEQAAAGEALDKMGWKKEF